MLWSEIIELISITHNVNTLGDIVEIKTKKQVYANETSVKRSEFYQAMQNGLRPEVIFEVKSIDYTDEKKIEWDSKEYNVIRTYSKDREVVELVCNRLVGG